MNTSSAVFFKSCTKQQPYKGTFYATISLCTVHLPSLEFDSNPDFSPVFSPSGDFHTVNSESLSNMFLGYELPIFPEVFPHLLPDIESHPS